MLLNGKKLEGPRTIPIVFPREDGDLIFQAKAVLDYSDFDALCPAPNPPEVMRPGGIKSKDVNDKKYLDAVQEWAEYKTRWIILESLSATEGLEWQKVDMSKPETWSKYAEELTEAGFTPGEQALLVNTVFEACGLNQDKIDEATKRFLASRQETKSE